ncbi:CotD family spore coat protein [Oceanobacillus jeddahense]|uniref:CotD family spore coat protein n=1 Tax=Oceanobacillus jeddahense TaxID=1462527 RepID=UPI000595883C|nr:CotD family spore coat protein [Oceanobacillus jeddahense]
MQGKQRFNQQHPNPNEKTIVHPTKHQYVHTSSESVVNHIHPVHTTYVNHHMIKNQHPYGKEAFMGRPQIGPRPPSPPMPMPLPGQMPPGNMGEMRRHPGIHPRRRPGMW